MFQLRLDLFRKTLKSKGLDGFLISNFYNIFYFSGFKTLTENEREGWVLVTSKNVYLFSDSRYITENTKSETRNPKQVLNLKYKLIKPEKSLIKHLEEIFKSDNIKTCGVEGDDLKVEEYHHLIKYLKGVRFLPAEQLIIKQRSIKDEEEIKKIKKACEITDQCLKETLRLIEVGKTEKEIAFKIEYWIKEKNYDLAFYPIVAFDTNSALAHYDTRSNGLNKVKKSSIILIDIGVKYQNYLSDITRMVFFGRQNSQILNTYKNLLDIQSKAIQKLKPGVKCSQVDLFCREKLNYYHSTGHGVGLEVHEFPKISPVSDEKLLENQVVTIEPGEYFEGKWGMRIEDTILVKKNGAEILTKFNKQILQISK